MLLFHVQVFSEMTTALVFLLAAVVMTVKSNEDDPEFAIAYGAVNLTEEDLNMSRYKDSKKSDQENCEKLIKDVTDNLPVIEGLSKDDENAEMLCSLDLGFVNDLLTSCSEESQVKSLDLINSYNALCPERPLKLPPADIRRKAKRPMRPATGTGTGKDTDTDRSSDATTANCAVSLSNPMCSGFFGIFCVILLCTFGLLQSVW